MRKILRLYKIMIRYWGFLLAGLFFMFGFALFSGVSITMAIPIFDNVFTTKETKIEITSYQDFSKQITTTLNKYIKSCDKISDIWEEKKLDSLQDQSESILSKTDPNLLLWIISGLVIILILLKNIFFYGNKVMFANLRGRTVRDVRGKMYSKYLYQPLSFFGTNRVGDSIVRMVSDVKIVSNLFIGAVFRMMQDITLLLVNTIIALLINPRLFLISLIVFPAFSIMLGYLGQKIKKYSKKLQRQSSELFSNVEEILGSMRIVKAFAREKYEQERFDKLNEKFLRFWRKSIIYSAFNTPLSEINSTLMGIIVLIIGGRQVLAPDSTFTYGYFMAFLLAIFSMLHPLKKITQSYAQIRKALVSLDRISVILEKDSELKDMKDAISKDDFTSVIEFKDVHFSYNKSSEVLTKINLVINKGERVALVGSSGSGKTTLVNLLTRMYDHNKGKITIDGIPIESIKLRNLRSLFGTVTQESILFSDTIKNNISYGSLKEINESMVITAAEIAYANEFIIQLPDKYNHILNVKASNLSGGQKQRLCIARAIVGNPPILIFDEATSALDSEAETNVQKAIEQATKNRTVIVIAHRLSTILGSDKIVVMDKGKIVGMGKHKDLLDNCPRYKILYDLQFADKG